MIAMSKLVARSEPTVVEGVADQHEEGDLIMSKVDGRNYFYC